MRITNPGSNYFSENKSFNGKKITENIKEEKQKRYSYWKESAHSQ